MAAAHAPGAWVYIAEIFPTNIRSRAMSFATSVLFFTLISALTAAGAFAVYAAICAVAVIFFFQLPETRGRSLEEIEQ